MLRNVKKKIKRRLDDKISTVKEISLKLKTLIVIMLLKIKLEEIMVKFCLLLVVVALLYFTNPSFEKHKSVVYSVIQQQTFSNIKNFFAVTGLGVAEAFGITPFEYDNYYVISFMRVDEKMISVGALGFFYIVYSQDVN
jgi:hypothetical protein